MSMNDSMKKAQKKYQAGLKAFTIRLKPEEMERYKAAADNAGMTFRNFVLSAMDKAIK
jgi:predicted DNA binding CopG/RHH family protein